MGRGANLIENILYGQVGSRGIAPEDKPWREVITVNNVKEYYDYSEELRKVVLPQGIQAEYGGVDFTGPAEIYLRDKKPHRDDDQPAVLYEDGTEEWFKDGKTHREPKCGPAVIRANGDQSYLIEDQYHRDDGPAIIDSDGHEEYWQNGKLHRDNGPAIIEPDGTQSYYQHGQLHRTDGPAVIKADEHEEEYWQNHKRHRTNGPAIIRMDGTEEWFQNDVRHRTDGPAIIRPDGTEGWYQNDQLHREGGPAIIRPDGSEHYYQNGQLHPSY